MAQSLRELNIAKPNNKREREKKKKKRKKE
jgi:hypothetical protein